MYMVYYKVLVHMIEEDLGKPVMQFEGRRSMSQFSSEKGSKFSLPLSFCSIQALSGLEEAHLHWEGLSALLYQFKC